MMTDLTYIVGARQTGKTTALRYFYEVGIEAVLVGYTIFDARRLRDSIPANVQMYSATHHVTNALRGLSDHLILADDIHKYPYAVQEAVLFAGRWNKVVCTVSPIVIDYSKTLPPFWKEISKANIIRTESKSRFSVPANISAEVVVTDFYGEFIVRL